MLLTARKLARIRSCFFGKVDFLKQCPSVFIYLINARFFLRGSPVEDGKLELVAATVSAVLPDDATFFEALTAVAFELYAQEQPGRVILETGLGGRFDATNICESELCIITKIGLDHCDWLGSTISEIASEKAGIIKPGVPVVVSSGSSEDSIRELFRAEPYDVFLAKPYTLAELKGALAAAEGRA